MAMPEQFSLRWNDFHSNLSQSFQALLDGEDLVDVTLAAGGQYVHAHKLILSVCSPYFKELFKMNPCDHPIVILKDVNHQELRQLLQFMYRGEVHVRQQELSGFLHTAELLQVKGLTGGREQSKSPSPVNDDMPTFEPLAPDNLADSLPEWVPPGDEPIMPETSPESANAATVKDETNRSPLKRLLKNAPNKPGMNVKKKSRPVNISNSPIHAENTEYASDGEPMIDFDSDMYNNVMVLPDSAKESGWNCKSGGVKCPSCHRFFANRYNLKVHIRDKHDTREGTLQCEICQKRMRNPSCLRVHMYHHRKQAAYLAQISAQGDQMRHVFQHYIRQESRLKKENRALKCAPCKDTMCNILIDINYDNMARSSKCQCVQSHPYERVCMYVQNMVGNKWRSDANAEFQDNDNFGATPPAETNKFQQAGESKHPAAAEPLPSDRSAEAI